MNKSKCDWSDLRELYLEKQNSCVEIAIVKGCNKRTVYDALERQGIHRRSKSQAAKIRRSNAKYNWSDLNNLYINQDLSGYQIAKIKACNPSVVYRALRSNNIPIRNKSKASILGFKTQRRVNPNLFKRGEKSHYWKGGRTKTSTGYILIYMPQHPNANSRGYILEHRLVMSQLLARPLSKLEKVHHKNGIKDSNERENLEILSPSIHALKEQFCKECLLKKRIKLLEWRVTQLEKDLQYKLDIEQPIEVREK